MGINVEVGDQIKVAFLTFFFQKNIDLFCFCIKLTFSWLTLDIATLFPSALADSVNWTISLAISQIVYSNTKSYWTGDFLFFLGRFHVLLRIVHFSTWETLYNNMRLKLSSLPNGVSIFFTIEPPKITGVGVFVFPLDTVFQCPFWSKNFYRLDNFRLDHDRFLWCRLAKFSKWFFNFLIFNNGLFRRGTP